jgi:hypothetical protein
LVNVWLIVEPELAEAPVMPPVLVPSVHANVLVAVALRLIFGPVPLHIAAVVVVVTAGKGLTVTVIVVAAPTHEAAIEVGVTI